MTSDVVNTSLWPQEGNAAGSWQLHAQAFHHQASNVGTCGICEISSGLVAGHYLIAQQSRNARLDTALTFTTPGNARLYYTHTRKAGSTGSVRQGRVKELSSCVQCHVAKAQHSVYSGTCLLPTVGNCSEHISLRT
jgi:hypothetical protein